MATTKVLLALSLCLVLSSAFGQLSERRLSYKAQQCRINQITSSEPTEKAEYDGGMVEFWDANEEQYQCSGIHAMRVTIQPNSLSLPNFHPFPRLVYVERGEGLLGLTFPGCPETYQSSPKGQHQRFRGEEQERGEFGERGQRGFPFEEQRGERGQRRFPFEEERGERRRGGEEEERGQFSERDLHQKVHRFRKGDLLAFPPGAVHWTYNDGNEELVLVTVNDLSNHANQLDQTFRTFYLAGALERSGRRGMKGTQRHQFQNIFAAFDPELMAEAFDVPQDLIRRIQQTEERDPIMKVERGQMRIMAPDEEEEYEYERRRDRYMGLELEINGLEEKTNGLEETICTTKLSHSLDSRREADVFSRQGGRLNIVNEHKFPLLKFLGMSAEKGHMFPNTIYSPHWSINSHSVIYVTHGEAHLQVVDNNGQTLMDDRVREGEMFVIPQFFTSTCRAGSNGFEYVSFKTTSSPMKSPVVGYTSVFRAMPLQVITNSYQISPSDAQNLKYNREHQTFFLSPRGGKGGRRF